MSKYRNWGRPNVERAIRQYPAIKAMQMEAQQQSVTANYSGMPRSGNVSRTTEQTAMRGLTPQEESVVRAVEEAMRQIARCRDGDQVMAVVNLVDFQRRYTVQGAAIELHMDYCTAKNKRTRFIDCVGKLMGY